MRDPDFSMGRIVTPPVLLFLSLSLAACGDNARLPEEAAVGPTPTLPEPKESLIPTVNIAPAKA